MAPIVDNRFMLEEFAICSKKMEQHCRKSNYEFLEAQFQERKNIIKGIPDFWQIAIYNHPVISAISERGQDVILKFLNDLRVEEYSADDMVGFRLCFQFDPNPFFTNEVLTKELLTLASGEKLTTSTEIQWNTMLDGTELQSVLKDSREIRSFLDWFMERDDSFVYIAERIRCDLWVNAFTYYMMSQEGEAVAMESKDFKTDDHLIVTAAMIEQEENRRAPNENKMEKNSSEPRRSQRLKSKPRINWKIWADF
ncbi:protein SET-like [Toxorhynchites rutilus septentrionalis]|uniref:protein SET-like n=1 Tax=Toxorhynchites rutilus septentrionalis TaxID=329112 RepID=UPI0024797CD4|nr:protein SET-like [Toxorhynchites rutilus septentrionalis]